MAYDWGAGAGDALKYGTTGATLGTAIAPGIGTAVGGGLGTLAGFLSQLFGSKDKNTSGMNFSSPEGISQLSTKTPEQQQGLSQVFGQLNQAGGSEGNYSRAQNHLSSILQGGPEGFNNFSQPYLQQFEQQIIPRLTERFASLGGGMGGGIGSSSGLGQALGGASSNLQSQLAQLYSQRQMEAAGQASNNYNNLAQIGLGQSPFENVYHDEGESPWGNIASLFAEKGLTQFLPMIMDYIKNQGQGGGSNSLMDSISNSPAAGPYGGGATYNPYTGVQ